MDIPVTELKRLTKETCNDIVIVTPVISGFWNNNQQDYTNSYFYPDYFNKDLQDIYSGSTTQLTNFKQTFLPIDVANKFKILKECFEKEKYKASISEDKISSIFQQLAVKIAELPFEKSSVEITFSESIKISMSFSGNLLLIVSKPFEILEDVSENDIIFSVFKNREMIVSNVAKTTEFVEGFKRFLLL